MTSPGGVEVGRVSIRVVPDTSKFARELRRKLQAIENSEKLNIPVQFEADREQLQRELEKLRVRAIEVPVEPDFTGFSRELNARLRAIKPSPIKVPAEPDLTGFRSNLNNQLRGIRPNTLKVPAEPDLTGFRTKLNNAVRAVVPTPVKVGAEPDLTQFRAQLRAQLAASRASVTVPVELSPNITAFRARLRSITGTVRVDLEPNITAFRARLRAIDAPTIRVNLEPNIADLRGRLAALPSTSIRVDLNPNLASFRARLRALSGTVNVNVDINEAALAARVAAAVRAGIALGSVGAGGNIARSLGGGFGSLIPIVAKVLALILAAAAAGFLLAVAGAAIAAAWGAASTAIAVLPGLLVGLAPAIGAVALGMEGIQKAAKTLQPEFDKLKTAVSDTFEKGFTDAFNAIRPIFPTIQGGMVGIAESINFVVGELAKFALEAQNAGLLETVFNRISGAIRALSPAINDLVFSFLEIASQKELWDGLTGAIQRFGASFKQMVIDRLADQSLQTAMTGLGVVIGSLGDAFVGLVNNGIRLFSTAWPGVAKAIDSLTAFFGKFNWERLGTAVSRVFDGLGKAIDKIPPGTIEEITRAFERLGDTFQDPAFQQGIADFVAGIPVAIDAINLLAQGFSRFGTSLKDTIDEFTQAIGNIGEFINRLGTIGQAAVSIIEGIVTTIINAGKIVGNPWDAWLHRDEISQAFQGARDQINSGVDQLGHAFTDPWPQFGSAAEAAARDALVGIPEAVLAPLREIPNGINTKTSPEVAAAVEALGGRSAVAAERAMELASDGAKAGLQPMPAAVEAGVAPAAAAVGTGLEPAAASAQTALDQVTAAVDTSIGGLGLRVTTAMSNVKAALGNSTREWAPAVKTGMDSVKVAMDTGFSQLITSAFTGLQGVTDRINASTPQWAAAIGLGMNTVVNNFTLAFNNIQLAVDTGWIRVQTSFTNGLTLINTTIVSQTAVWAANIGLGFNTIANTVTIGMGLVVTAVQTGMITVQTAFTTGLTTINTTLVTQSAIWAATLSLAMNTLLNTVVLGFSNIVSQVQIGLVNVTTSFTTGWGTINTGLSTAMTTAVETVRTGMTDMTAAARDGMIQITTEYTNGSSRAVTIINQMIRSCVSALNAAVNQFRTAGANMGQALADGLDSKASVVEAAARRLANAAAAAMRAAAQINSPSRVTMSIGESLGEGLANGMDDSHTMVSRAAQRLVSEIEDHLYDVANTAQDIGSQMELTPTVNGSKVLNSAALPVGAGNGGVDITNNIYNPLPETGSDSVAKTARRQARLGLFG